MAAADDVQKVADYGSGGRGDNSHGARKGGQGALAGGVEEAFGFQAFLELLKGQLQRARAHRFHGLGHQLHLTALFIDAHLAANQHMQTVFRAEAQQHGIAPEENHGQLGVGVFEGEVKVARGRGTEV